jgi:hypothetical protein
LTALSPDKIAMLKGLFAASPDDVVRALERAVCKEDSNGSLAAIGAMIETEVAVRSVRAHVLAPVKGLFRARHADDRTAFPIPALSLLWKALEADRPELVKQAQDTSRGLYKGKVDRRTCISVRGRFVAEREHRSQADDRAWQVQLDVPDAY